MIHLVLQEIVSMVTVEWLTQSFHIIDTGGIQIEDQPFSEEINMQVDIAIEEADVIIFYHFCQRRSYDR